MELGDTPSPPSGEYPCTPFVGDVRDSTGGHPQPPSGEYPCTPYEVEHWGTLPAPVRGIPCTLLGEKWGQPRPSQEEYHCTAL